MKDSLLLCLMCEMVKMDMVKMDMGETETDSMDMGKAWQIPKEAIQRMTEMGKTEMVLSSSKSQSQSISRDGCASARCPRRQAPCVVRSEESRRYGSLHNCPIGRGVEAKCQ